MLKAGWDRLVEILDAGGYARYDFSTATKLLEIMTVLQQKYGGLENLYCQAPTEKDLEKRLLEFNGVGPTTAQIFLRELRGIWHLQPRVAEIAQAAARTLSIDLSQLEAERLARVETALVKLYLRYCKKRKCNECPMEDFCKHKIRQ
jgi:endonuclease III